MKNKRTTNVIVFLIFLFLFSSDFCGLININILAGGPGRGKFKKVTKKAKGIKEEDAKKIKEEEVKKRKEEEAKRLKEEAAKKLKEEEAKKLKEKKKKKRKEEEEERKRKEKEVAPPAKVPEEPPFARARRLAREREEARKAPPVPGEKEVKAPEEQTKELDSRRAWRSLEKSGAAADMKRYGDANWKAVQTEDEADLARKRANIAKAEAERVIKEKGQDSAEAKKTMQNAVGFEEKAKALEGKARSLRTSADMLKERIKLRLAQKGVDEKETFDVAKGKLRTKYPAEEQDLLWKKLEITGISGKGPRFVRGGDIGKSIAAEAMVEDGKKKVAQLEGKLSEATGPKRKQIQKELDIMKKQLADAQRIQREIDEQIHEKLRIAYGLSKEMREVGTAQRRANMLQDLKKKIEETEDAELKTKLQEELEEKEKEWGDVAGELKALQTKYALTDEDVKDTTLKVAKMEEEDLLGKGKEGIEEERQELFKALKGTTFQVGLIMGMGTIGGVVSGPAEEEDVVEGEEGMTAEELMQIKAAKALR